MIKHHNLEDKKNHNLEDDNNHHPEMKKYNLRV